MSVQFTENNGKQWIFFKGKYLNSDENSKMLLSNDTEKVLEDCINSCSKNNDCQWFVWSTDNGKCLQFKFLENNDSTFQWRYDYYKYNGMELLGEVFNLEHDTETQEQCINDCYNDTNCVGVNYINNSKHCRIFYNYSNENTYFGYYAVNQNENPVGGELTSIGDDIYNTEANIKNNSFFSLEKVAAFILAMVLIILSVVLFMKYKKNNNKGEKLPPLPPRDEV
ncbi:hypothetical protein BCR36DRAFT_355908 [Piromyces finnis]|uniref:Apple domain-containing protein n=1 Tax=Piromyces finnis TaxID=1754191 RepID=A0A1Y1V4N4_9FUNG|nr:hypothetical protein BCR36DRAFT_355908 [Piromyces finnis]|eukprot:ORX47308.1 hypothetical protein BCR36DRAFT_355908 [Piromyces finnis]